MIVDRISRLNKYIKCKDSVELISNFIEKSKFENLEDGKYTLDEDSLFALVQTYETKNESECKWESHEKYIDLQFIEKGKEIMRWNTIDSLDIEKSYNKYNDLTIYANNKSKLDLVIEPDMFVLFYPTDAHKPCIKVYEKEYVKKIVFKISTKQGG